MSWPWATRPQGRGAFSSGGGGGPSRQHGNGSSTNGTGMSTSISKTPTPSSAQSTSRKTQAASTSSGKRKKKKRPVQGEDRFEGQLAYSVGGEKAPFKPFATTLRQLRAGVPPKNALAPLITPRSRYTRSYFVQYGGREMYSSVVERLSFRFKAGVHDEGYYCRFCENRIPGDKTFRVLDYAAHFTGGGCPALTGPDLETFVTALREVDPTTTQELEHERAARKHQEAEQSKTPKRARAHHAGGDDDGSDYDSDSESESSGSSEDSDDSCVAGPVASTSASASQSWQSWQVPQSLMTSSQPPTSLDPLAGQIARISNRTGGIGSPMIYTDEPLKLLSETLRELRGGAQPDTALTARISLSASRLRGYYIDLDDIADDNADHSGCLDSCDRQPHEFGLYCRLCFHLISISPSVAYRLQWRHFRGGFCSALSGADLELFLLAIQEVDKRFCAKLEEAGELKKIHWRTGKPKKKRTRTGPGVVAGRAEQGYLAPASELTPSIDPSTSAAPLPTSMSLKLAQQGAGASTRQMDLTYGPDDDDEDDSDQDLDIEESFFGYNTMLRAATPVKEAEKAVVIASLPSPFRVKKQSPDGDALFSTSQQISGGQSLSMAKAALKAPKAVISDLASTLPAPVVPYATILEASGISTNEDFEGLRGMILSQADLDGFLASVYSDHEKSLSLTTIKKFGLRQSLIKALGLA